MAEHELSHEEIWTLKKWILNNVKHHKTSDITTHRQGVNKKSITILQLLCSRRQMHVIHDDHLGHWFGQPEPL